MRKFLAPAISLLLALPSGALAQDTPARIKSRSELVVVPVTVKDRRGVLVPDLRREEFRVLEDGVEQDIALFSAESFPLSAVIVVDNDLSMHASDAVQQSLESVSGGFGPSDEAALLLFDEFPEPVLDFTADNDKLLTQLKRTKLGSSISPGQVAAPTVTPPITGQPGSPVTPSIPAQRSRSTKCADDAIHAAGEMLRSRGRDRRKIIFLISDGSNSRNNQWSFDDTLRLLLSADVSVYSIVVGSGLLKHGSNLLSKYATDTGGDSFSASKQRDLERLYPRLTEQARTQYTLAYAPHNADPKRSYHSIDVRVRRPDLNLLARQGYYTAAPR
jgi:VWFA-related protein